MCNCHSNKIKCYFIPPDVQTKMAREGVEGAQSTILKSQQIRGQRKAREISSERLEAGIDNTIGTQHLETGHSKRIIYDCKNGEELRINNVRNEGDPSIEDDSANDVYNYAGIVRDYFKNLFNRDSIDNQGLDLILNIHFGSNFNNALFDGDEMIFGDGDGKKFISFSHSKDVVGHELTHGIVQYTAALEYYSQSGALNEHFADVFLVLRLNNIQITKQQIMQIGLLVMTLWGQNCLVKLSVQ